MEAEIPPWEVKCLEYISMLGGKPCPPEQCAEVSKYTHAICTCQPPYQNGCAGNPTPGCCAYEPSSPVYVVGGDRGCYCCCGDAANGPLNAADARSERPVAAFREGDTVYVAADGSLQRWETRPVAFSAGTGPIAGAAVRLRFRRGDGEASLVVHRDRPFPTAGRALRRAGELVPGVDALVDRDGGALPLLAVEEAGAQPLHHLSTSRQPATGVGGHLVLLDGVVAGDFALQMADLATVGLAPAGA